MKRLLFFFWCLIALSVRGANPSFNDLAWTNTAGYIFPKVTTNTVAVPGSLWVATNAETSLLVGDVQAGINEYGLPYEPFKFGIFRVPTPTGADIDVIWKAFSPNNSATHEFYSIARTNDGNTLTFHEVRAIRDGVNSTMTMQAQATTNNVNCNAFITANTLDQTASLRSAFDLKTFGSFGAVGNGNGEAMFRLKTTRPNITNVLFVDFQTNSISVFSINDRGVVKINAAVTNSIDMLDTNGTTRTKIYSQGGTLYSSASPSSRTVSDDEWKAMNGSSTTTNIDGKSIANTTLYTVPTGRQFVIERIIIIPTTTAAVITPPTVSIGKTSAAFIDVVAAGALTGLTATLTSATLAPIVGASVIDSGEALVLRVSSGASATTYTFKAVVIGTLL